MIGGLVVFVSVILELFTVTGLLNLLFYITAGFLELLSMPAELSPSLINGIFEVTLGAKAAGAADSAIPLVHKVAMAAFVLSWAGLSVHAQIASLLTTTDLRYHPFVTARLLHGVIAAILVYALWKPLGAVTTSGWFVIPAGLFDEGLSLFTGFSLSAIVFLSVLLLIPLLYTLFVLFSLPLSIMMKKIKR